MGLSVIVTSFGSPGTLAACLDALDRDPHVTQILVADCSPVPPHIPHPLRRFPTPTSVPVMRWSMMDAVSEPIVACLEGRCIPAPGWGAGILAAHAAHPEAVAVGGSVALAQGASWLDKTVWFCEYAAFSPPLPETLVREISGANLSYKADLLREEADLLEAGAWETLIHLRWVQNGKSLCITNAPVEFRNALSGRNFARQRLDYGRGYAASRAVPPRRWLYAMITPVLPYLLSARTLRHAVRADRIGEFLLCLPAVFFFHSLWSWGELLGYCFGPSRRQSNY